MKESDIFYTPFLKKRVDNSRPKYNPIYGEIADCFNNFEWDTFHFFTAGENRTVLERAWKIILLKDPMYYLEIDDLIKFLGKDKLINETIRLKKYGINLEYIVFYDSKNWEKSPNVIYIITFSFEDGNLRESVKTITISQFETMLFRIQGESMIMNKPLTYSHTELEGYLADMCQRYRNPINRAIFPGDVDCLLIKDNEYKCLIEFKKHSLATPLAEESFRKYWYLDKKKYRGIAALTRELGFDYFFNIIYPTKVDTNKIKIEKIKSNGFLEESIIKSFKTKEELMAIIDDYFKLYK